MKILLINDNPVVGKLVTLSAQKTGDELASVSSIQEAKEGKYDLLVIDDASYDKEQLAALSGTVAFSKSCFIGSRTTERPEGFTRELNKPFLPTDLVEIFAGISSELAKKAVQVPDTLDELDLEDDFEDSLANIDDLDETLGSLDDTESLDETEAPDAIEEIEAADMDTDLEIEDVQGDDDSDLLLLDDALDDLVDELASEEKGESILDEEDVKEVQGLLDETDEILDDVEDFDQEENDMISERPLADEATLNEINKALEELEEDDESVSLDEALNDLGIEPEASLGIDPDEIDTSILDSMEEVLSDNLDSLELGEEKSTDEEADLITEDLDKLLEDEAFTDDKREESVIAESDEELLGMEDEENSDEEADLITEELDGLLEDDAFTDENTEAAVIEEAGEDLIQETADEESSDELDDELSKLLSEAEEEDVAAADELEDLLEEDDQLDSDALSDEETVDEDLDDVMAEVEGDLELDALLEEIAEEDKQSDPGDAIAADTFEDEEVDLSALNDEIEEALEGLDEDDLEGEVEGMDALSGIEGMDDVFSSLSSNELKRALGEEVQEESIDEEEAKIREEIEALESTLEEEEEIAFSVGKSEFASLNEEALNEAMGEEIEGDNEHPELEEVDAFVDAVAIEGSAGGSSSNGPDENIVALEELIATLKQANVKEALKGMKMNISISFSEKNG